MVISGIQDLQVKIHSGTVRYGIEKFTNHFGIHCSEERYGKFSLEVQVGSARKIDSSECKCLIHWEYKIAVTFNTGFIA